MNVISKRKAVLIAVLIVTHLGCYMFGSIINRQTMLRALALDYARLNATTSLGLYTVYRDIAVYIKEGQYARAACSANLEASAEYETLKSCLADGRCASEVQQKAHQVAPEVFGEAPLAFTYLPKKGAIRSCE